jgi:hypothetical protein
LFLRDGLAYMSVIVDDTNRKPIARLYLNNPNRKRVCIFCPDGEGGRREVMYDLESVNDLQAHAEAIRQAAEMYS